MSEVSSSSDTGTSVDMDAFAYELVLSRTLEEMFKRPDDDASSSDAATSVVNKTIASSIAQSISGFGT